MNIIQHIHLIETLKGIRKLFPDDYITLDRNEELALGWEGHITKKVQVTAYISSLHKLIYAPDCRHLMRAVRAEKARPKTRKGVRK